MFATNKQITGHGQGLARPGAQLKDDDARRTRFISRLRIAGARLVLMIGTLLFGLTYSKSGQLSLPVQPS